MAHTKDAINERVEQLVQDQFENGTLVYGDSEADFITKHDDGTQERIGAIRYEVQMGFDNPDPDIRPDVSWRYVWVPLSEMVMLYDAATAQVESGLIDGAEGVA